MRAAPNLPYPRPNQQTARLPRPRQLRHHLPRPPLGRLLRRSHPPSLLHHRTINKALSAWNRMRLLGGSLFANLSDIGLQHPLQLWLQNGLPLWHASLNPILSAHKLATNKQLNNFLNELGIGIESQFAQLYAAKFTGTITQPGDLISRAEGAFVLSSPKRTGC